MDSPLYGMAVQYRNAGISTVPFAQEGDGSKHPAWNLLPHDKEGKPTWIPFQEYIVDENNLHYWFAGGDAQYMAAVTGEVSGNLVGLDFDNPSGSSLYAEYIHLLEEMAPNLRTLPTEYTPNGGRHVYFRSPVEPDSTILAQDTFMVNDKPVKKGLIELKGRGSCLNCYPSPGYSPLYSDLTMVPTLTQQEVHTLLTICKSLDRVIPPSVKPRTSDRGREEGPADRFNEAHSINDMINWLVAAGWVVTHERRGVTYLRRPGKDRGVSGTVGWGGLNIFRNFSASTEFVVDKAYSCFGLYAMLKHGGDLGAAARAIKETEAPIPTRKDIQEYYEHQGEAPPEEEQAAPSAEEEDRGSFNWFRPVTTFPELPRIKTEWLVVPQLIEYADLVSKDRCVPPEYVVGAILATLSASIGVTRRVRLAADWLEYPSVWSCLVGDPGSGKTPSARKVLETTRERHGVSRRRYARDMQEFEDEKQDYASKPKNQRGIPPKEPALKNIIVSDITLEAVAHELERNPRGLLLDRDELLGWISSFNQYKGGQGSDRDNWLSMWSCNQISVDRVNGTHIYVEDPFVAILGGTQPARITEAFKDTSDGLQDRILFFFPPKDAQVARTLQYAASAPINHLAPIVNNLYQLVGEDVTNIDGTVKVMPYECHMTREAWDFFAKKYVLYAGPRCSSLSSAFSKAATEAGRIALILHLAQTYAERGVEEGPIELYTVQCAFAIVEYCMRVRLYLDWLAAGKERSKEPLSIRLKKTLDWVMKQPTKSATVRDLMHGKVGGMVAKTEVETVMRELADLGYGTMEKVTNQGRETHVFALPK